MSMSTLGSEPEVIIYTDSACKGKTLGRVVGAC